MPSRLMLDNWTVADLETATEEERALFWQALELRRVEDDGSAAAVLAAGQPLYTMERDKPAGAILKTYPDRGR